MSTRVSCSLQRTKEMKDDEETRSHYLRFVQAAMSDLAVSGQATWRATLEADHDNIRAALRFSLDTGDSATAVQLCASLWRFWFERGYSAKAGDGWRSR